MQNKTFRRLLSQVNTLTPTQSKQLQNKLNQKCSIKTLDDTTGEISHCPHCGATSVYKWGYRSECCNVINVKNVIKHLMP